MTEEQGWKEEEFRNLAKELLPEWFPWGLEREKSQGTFGIPGLGGTISKNEEGKYELWVHSRKQKGVGTSVPLIYGLEAIRKSAIGVLIFCELEEWRNENGC